MNPIDGVQQYLQAHNAHAVERVLSLLTDDFRFELVGVWTRKGKTLARELEEWDAVLHSQLVAGQLVLRGKEVICAMREYNDWFQLAGITEVQYESCTFRLRDGQIASITAILTPESSMVISQALKAILEWAKWSQPNFVIQYMPDSQFVYNHESASAWLELLAAWRSENANGLRTPIGDKK